MAMETLYRIRCDERGDCDRVIHSVATTPADARKLAEQMGWDLGPRQHPRIAGRIDHTDFCPQHKKREPEPYWRGEADR